MASGPVTVFDKSALQALNLDEACLFGNFYRANITPLFFVETLADLEKEVAAGRTPEDVVGSIAHKTLGLHCDSNIHHRPMGIEDLYSGGVDMHGVPVISGARHISESDCDVVSLQHEFGIWGGKDGHHLADFLMNIKQPVVSTLHTTFNRDHSTPERAAMIGLLVERSAFTIVLTSHAKATVEALLGRPITSIVVMPHGIHTVPFVPPPHWPDPSPQAPFRLITPGYFRENKGLETVLLALSRMVRDGLNAVYRIAGEPQGQFREQRDYVEWLQALIRSLGLESVVHLDLKYLSLQEQVDAIRMSHAGVFAYQAAEQSSSGTVPLVLAAGRPAICTPFEFACSKATEGRGIVLAESYGFGAVERAIKSLMKSPTYGERAIDSHRMAETWSWPRVGARFAEVCAEASLPLNTQ